jgi:predicted NAD-dependent protein-ADP-ribosyltransferase YbiA (DUF1768 family)
VAPALGTPASGVATNLTGTAAGLTAGNVTTNANLTGPITSVGNATTIVGPIPAVTLSGTISGGGNQINNVIIGTVTPLAGSFTNITGSANAIISVTDNTNAALRITQLGTGNALLVEDTTNPDASPFVVDANGRLIVGHTTSLIGSASLTAQIQQHGATNNTSGVALFNWAASATGTTQLQINKSKSGTIGTNGAVASGDYLGSINFSGDDGTAFIRAAEIRVDVDGTPGTNDMPGRLVFSTTADGASSTTERMRISSTGQTTISGNAIISVTDNTNAALRITQTGTGNALLVEDSSSTDNTPFVIDSTGYVILGHTSNITSYQIQTVSAAPLDMMRWNAASSGPTSRFAKSRSATIGTYSIVSNGDSLGALNFDGDDGTQFARGASISANVDGTPGTSDMPGRLVFSTTADGASSPTERMRIDSTGQTTISGNAIISVTDNTNAALRITQLGTGNALLVEDTTNPDSTPFVIDASGNVIVGYTALVATANDAGSAYTPANQIHGLASQAKSSLALYNWIAGATNESNLTFSKSKSGAFGAFTVSASGDSLGAINFAGDDGAAFITAASIAAAVDGTAGLNDMPGRLVFSTTADGASSPTERMRISSAGNVGIGGTPGADISFVVSKNITGATTAYGIAESGTVQSDVTSAANMFLSNPKTVASAFTITTLNHYSAIQGAIGATSAVTNQFSFNVASNNTGATNNYGYYSNIAAAANRWNFYANGTARNYMAADLTVSGATAIPAGGTAGAGLMVSTTANFGVFFGSGAPTLSAAKGSLYLRSDGSTVNDRMYVNTDGSTTWTSVVTSA